MESDVDCHHQPPPTSNIGDHRLHVSELTFFTWPTAVCFRWSPVVQRPSSSDGSKNSDSNAVEGRWQQQLRAAVSSAAAIFNSQDRLAADAGGDAEHGSTTESPSSPAAAAAARIDGCPSGRQGAGISNNEKRMKVIRLARRVDDEDDDDDDDTNLVRRHWHVRGSHTKQLPQRPVIDCDDVESASAAARVVGVVVDFRETVVFGRVGLHQRRRTGSGNLSSVGTGNERTVTVSDYGLMLGTGGEMDGSWSSNSRESSSLQSPAELQRLIHVTSVWTNWRRSVGS
jgi:hypothetical protein